MSPSKARRPIVAAVAIAMCLGTVSSVGALPAVGFTNYWFSDDGFNTFVGEDTLLCSGQRIRWGQLSGRSERIVTENCGTTQFIYQCWADTNNDRILESVGCPW